MKETKLPDLQMVFVNGGSFLRGGQDHEALDREKPVLEVTVEDFYINKYPVTQALWKAVMGADNNPSNFRHDNRPVEKVSWNEARDFIDNLNELTGEHYRLLTESEWEFAARGGTKSQGFKYAGSNKLKKVAWFFDNSYGETKPVGLKYPNELGLFDMSGNVYEWVEDQYHKDYSIAPTDGTAWVDQDRNKIAYRVIRGGSWYLKDKNCRVAFRNFIGPVFRLDFVGFRLGL